jgi:hypothetical protein
MTHIVKICILSVAAALEFLTAAKLALLMVEKEELIR